MKLLPLHAFSMHCFCSQAGDIEIWYYRLLGNHRTAAAAFSDNTCFSLFFQPSKLRFRPCRRSAQNVFRRYHAIHAWRLRLSRYWHDFHYAITFTLRPLLYIYIIYLHMRRGSSPLSSGHILLIILRWFSPLTGCILLIIEYSLTRHAISHTHCTIGDCRISYWYYYYILMHTYGTLSRGSRDMFIFHRLLADHEPLALIISSLYCFLLLPSRWPLFPFRLTKSHLIFKHISGSLLHLSKFPTLNFPCWRLHAATPPSLPHDIGHAYRPPPCLPERLVREKCNLFYPTIYHRPIDVLVSHARRYREIIACRQCFITPHASPRLIASYTMLHMLLFDGLKMMWFSYFCRHCRRRLGGPIWMILTFTLLARHASKVRGMDDTRAVKAGRAHIATDN